MEIIRPLTKNNRVLNTIVANMEADGEYNDPTLAFVKACEDKLISQIKMMRVGNATKGDQGAIVMQACVAAPEGAKLLPREESPPRNRESLPEMSNVTEPMTKLSKNMAT